MISIQTDKVLSDVKVLSDDELNEVSAASGGWDLSFLSSPQFHNLVMAQRIGGLLSWLTHLRL